MTNKFRKLPNLVTQKLTKCQIFFRQGGNDFNTLANYAASAIKMLSLVLTVVGGGSGGGQSPGSTDRIDPGTVAGSAVTIFYLISCLRPIVHSIQFPTLQCDQIKIAKCL